MAEQDFKKLTGAAAKMAKSPLHIDDTPGLSILQLRARARRMWQQHKIKLIIIDYLQLMHSDSKKAQDNRQQEISDISNGVKALAKELNIPIIVLSQLNRELEKDKNRKPRLSDLRESGAIEQDADVVLVEGAGGLLVPIDLRVSYLDLFARWQLPLLLVAGNKLGVLNHVLLTVRAAETAGVPVRAIVLTSLSDRDATVAETTNFDALVTLLPHYTILRFPWVDRPDDLDILAAAAEGGGLDVLLSPSSP